jgi:hypothetical protein
VAAAWTGQLIWHPQDNVESGSCSALTMRSLPSLRLSRSDYSTTTELGTVPSAASPSETHEAPVPLATAALVAIRVEGDAGQRW